jgi:putative glutamine amidotransferase
MGTTHATVNSRHHQVVDPQHIGDRLKPVAFAPDGTVEAAEDPISQFLIAVQWHPEDLTDRPEQLRLFQALVAAARR